MSFYVIYRKKICDSYIFIVELWILLLSISNDYFSLVNAFGFGFYFFTF